MSSTDAEHIESTIAALVGFFSRPEVKAQMDSTTSRDTWRFYAKVSLYGVHLGPDGNAVSIEDGLNEGYAKDLIDRADAGDSDAQGAIQDIIAELVERGEPLPKLLRDYHLRDMRNPPRPRSPGLSPHSLSSRDGFIAHGVYLAGCRGFDPYRNDATRQADRIKSGCWIVASALQRIGVHKSERSIERIWRTRSHVYE